MDEKEFLKMALCQVESRLRSVLNDLNEYQNTEKLVEELQKRAIHNPNNSWHLDVYRKPDFDFFSGDPTKRAKIKKYRVVIHEVEE